MEAYVKIMNNNKIRMVKKMTNKICPKCGAQLHEESFCPDCGFPLNQNIQGYCSTGECHKIPIISLALSLIFPGMGQLYNEQIHKATVFVIAYVISLILCLIVIGIPFAIIILAYSMYDAFTSARALNRGEILEDKIF